MRFTILLIVFVSVSAAGFSDTYYVPGDYATIQDAIDGVSGGDTIIVKPGTYMENIDFQGKSITVQSQDGPQTTIIDGGDPPGITYRSVVRFMSGEGPGAILDGFTLQNGKGVEAFNQYWGGGIYCEGSSPTIINNIITLNLSIASDHLRGAGICCRRPSEPWIENNTITRNFGAEVGGGIFCSEEANATITGNTITEHWAMKGGGISVWECSDVTISHNLIEGNGATVNGGGIHIERAAAGIYNNIIRDNISEASGYIYGGGGLFIDSDMGGCNVYNNLFLNNLSMTNGGGLEMRGHASLIYNNTFVNNEAAGPGGGLSIYPEPYHTPQIFNCIVWGNSAPTGAEIYIDTASGGIADVTYCDIRDGCMGEGNIDADPLFADAANDDYHLTWISPCINQGTNDDAPALDYDGHTRPHMGTSEIGFDEFIETHPLEADIFTLSQPLGGEVNFSLKADTPNGGRNYILLGSVTGTAPGFPLPGGYVTLPLNWDFFSEFIGSLINTTLFSNFMGDLDASGEATAMLDTLAPLPPGALGYVMHFAYALRGPWNFVSNPVVVEIVP